jgi:hypothetical protein
MTKTCGTLAATGLLACLAAPAAAEATVDAAAVARGDNISTVHRVDGAHVLVWTVTEYDPLEAEDPDSPMNGLGGPCFGQVEIRGEEASGGGYCTWTDGEGDSYVVRWTATSVGGQGSGESVTVSTNAGAGAGEWTAVGGTGKWEGVTGSGTYSDEEELETGRRVNRMTGQVTLR